MFKKAFLLCAIYLLVMNCNILLAEGITLDELLSNMQNALSPISDYSCKVVSTAGEHPVFTEMEKTLGQSLPRITEISLWIKKPYMMKMMQGTEVTSIIKKEGADLYGYTSILGKNQIYKQKLSLDGWPTWPSFEGVLAIIKVAKDNSSSYDIEQKEDAMGVVYKLTFTSANSKREDIYYIKKSDWLIYKSVVNEDGKMVTTSEWQDVKINTNLSGDVFKVQVPEGTQIINQDFDFPSKQ